MNIETKIDERIWENISSNYEKRNYTGAIIDAIYYLSELIREKTGLESDGVALIGQAFGGRAPKIKLNKLQSESDWNEQKGIEQILRGIFQAIRNPRSHKKYNDSQEDTDSIILFINYLIHKIDKSKTDFSINQIKKRVFDIDFVKSDRYAQLIIKKIPIKKRLDVLIEIFPGKSFLSISMRSG